jgi:hypothetical protein
MLDDLHRYKRSFERSYENKKRKLRLVMSSNVVAVGRRAIRCSSVRKM